MPKEDVIEIIFVTILAGLMLLVAQIARAEEIGTASWYSYSSCIREGTSGICANGEVMDDEKLICAKWGLPFGTRLRVRCIDTDCVCIVTVADRGPAKALVKKGRVIDLSPRAFRMLAPLSKGIINVSVEVL